MLNDVCILDTETLRWEHPTSSGDVAPPPRAGHRFDGLRLLIPIFV